MKILIVEDQEPVAKALKATLEPLATMVVLADTLAKAKEFLKAINPLDLITVDVRLPDGGAREIKEYLAEIRSIQPNAVVIILSGVIERGEEIEFLEAGADGVLAKMDVRTPKSLYEKIESIADKILKSPPRFQRQLAIVEMMSHRLTGYLKDQGSRSPHLHACLLFN